MPPTFLDFSPSTWNIIFLITRYVLVALVLAYLTNVFVKRRNTITDIKGRVLERQVETYKGIHRWVMRFRSVIAAPSQYEDYYRNIISRTKFKIGYQGMEYASFFDDPERLLQFDKEFNQMLKKEENLIDEALQQKLYDFQEWLDTVLLFYRAFVLAEAEKRWHFDTKTTELHCQLACRLLGIALQEDVNKYFEQIDRLLRDRLGDVKIAGVYSDSKRLWGNRKAKPYYNKSQFHIHNGDLMTIFVLVHLDEMFAENPAIMDDPQRLMSHMQEFSDCYMHYLKQ